MLMLNSFPTIKRLGLETLRDDMACRMALPVPKATAMETEGHGVRGEAPQTRQSRVCI